MTVGTPSMTPDWPHCGHGANPAADPVGCRGRRVPDRATCIKHLDQPDRAAYLSGLAPGDDVDHRGTDFTEALLEALLEALRDPETGHPRFGHAQFNWARFHGGADFSNASFRSAGFIYAWFHGRANFRWVTFADAAWFGKAHFIGSAWFNQARFTGGADFNYAEFRDFESVTFGGAAFTDGANFAGVIFPEDVSFGGATFTAVPEFGPLVCAGTVDLSRAVFDAPVEVEIAAREVCCQRTRWRSTAVLRLRYATVDLSDAVLSCPVAVRARLAPFDRKRELRLSLATPDSSVRVASVRGVDAAHLVLTDINLETCLFSGAFHLDQLRLEGRCTFASTPARIHWHELWPLLAKKHRWRELWPLWWSRRNTLAEEHHWRAQQAGDAHLSEARSWVPPSADVPTPKPRDVAAVYRQLRKGFEDSRNAPGAADFYYGEMEMRRNDLDTPGAERWLLRWYWRLSGYGLRALRPVCWLVGTMFLTVILLMALGLPHDPGPTQQTQGTVAAGRDVNLITTPQEPSGAAPGAKFTWLRTEWATRTALNSAVFRSAGEGLTTWGTYIEMASRFLEPILLILALLAVRNRVKR